MGMLDKEVDWRNFYLMWCILTLVPTLKSSNKNQRSKLLSYTQYFPPIIDKENQYMEMWLWIAFFSKLKLIKSFSRFLKNFDYSIDIPTTLSVIKSVEKC